MSELSNKAVAASVGFFLVLLPASARAQVLLNAGTPFSVNAMAVADVVRATGSFQKSMAEADLIHEHAKAIRIENSVAATKAFWERREIWETEIEKRRDRRSFRVLRERRNRQQLEIMRLASSEKRREAVSGKNLNTLLDILFPLLQERDLSKSKSSLRTIPVTDLDEVLVCTPLSSAASVSFVVSKGVQDSPVDWPSFLQRESFGPARKNLEQSRTRLIKAYLETDGAGDAAKYLERLESAHADLVRLVNVERGRNTHLEVSDWQFVNDAREFLDGLKAEIIQFKRSGSRGVRRLQKFNGGTMEAFVNYLGTNNLQFAPGHPAASDVYARLYDDMMMLERKLDQAKSTPK